MSVDEETTLAALRDPMPGMAFHEMYSWWEVVVATYPDAVIVFTSTLPPRSWEPAEMDVCHYASADEFTRHNCYISPGLQHVPTVSLSEKRVDVAGWLDTLSDRPISA